MLLRMGQREHDCAFVSVTNQVCLCRLPVCAYACVRALVVQSNDWVVTGIDRPVLRIGAIDKRHNRCADQCTVSAAAAAHHAVVVCAQRIVRCSNCIMLQNTEATWG
jgi:hypothetical protein